MEENMDNQDNLTLKEYLYNTRMSVAQFARMIDYSRPHIYGILNGRLLPGDKFARTVERATKGIVKSETLLNRPIVEIEKNTDSD